MEPEVYCSSETPGKPDKTVKIPAKCLFLQFFFIPGLLKVQGNKMTGTVLLSVPV